MGTSGHNGELQNRGSLAVVPPIMNVATQISCFFLYVYFSKFVYFTTPTTNLLDSFLNKHIV